MKNVRFVGLDVHAETIAVAVAEVGGEVRSLGVIPNRAESVRLEGAKAVEVQDRRLMPSHRLFGVVGEIYRLQGDGDSIGDVCQIAAMKGLDRIESLGRFEVTATQEKDQLVARRAQA